MESAVEMNVFIYVTVTISSGRWFAIVQRGVLTMDDGQIDANRRYLPRQMARMKNAEGESDEFVKNLLSLAFSYGYF